MATLRTVTVTPLGGGDYTSLAAAEAGEQADLVTLDRRLDIECHPGEDTTEVIIDGSVADATRYIRVSAAPGARATARWADTALYTYDGGSKPLTATTTYTQLDGLRIISGSTVYALQASNGVGKVVENCFIVSLGGSVGALRAWNGPHAIRNCILLQGRGATTPGADLAFGSGSIDNCVVANVSGSGGGPAIQNNGSYVVRNCMMLGFGAVGGPGEPFDTGSTNNATDLAAGEIGASPLYGTDPGYVDPFTQYVWDFTLPAGSSLIDAGADLSAEGFTTDLLGTVRPQGAAWDVGATEYVVAGGEPEPATLALGFHEVAVTSFAGSLTEGKPPSTLALSYHEVPVTGFQTALTPGARTLAVGFHEVAVTGFESALSEGTPPNTLAASFHEVQVTGFDGALTAGTPPGVIAMGFHEVPVTGFPSALTPGSRTLSLGFHEVELTGFESALTAGIPAPASLALSFHEIEVTGFLSQLMPGGIVPLETIQFTLQIVQRQIFTLGIVQRKTFTLKI